MTTAWEGEDRARREWTRREWAKLAIAAGAASSVVAVGGTVSGQLLPPPLKFPGELREQVHYTKWPTDAWWNDLAGRQVRVSDFQEWQGATGVWRGLFLRDQWVPGTGYPVLVIRLKYDAPEFHVPTDFAPPNGFSFFYDDPEQQVRIVTLFDRCTHLCCFPGWHVIPVSERNYRLPPPTWAVYGQDPILCVCHGSQYDPLLITANVHPRSGAVYLGATYVHGPTQRALPLIPIRAERGVLVGGMPDPRWYDYC